MPRISFIRALGPFALGLAFAPLVHAESATIPNASFEQVDPDSGKPALWSGKGEFSAEATGTAAAGERVLLLKRDPVHLPETSVASEPLPLSPGVWEFTGTYSADLQSPDVSFNVSVSIASLDMEGKVLKTRRLIAAAGKSAWTRFAERVEIPAGTATARIELAYNKTHGEFRLDDLALKYIGASIPMEGGDRRVVFQSSRMGNLFYPGDEVRLEMTVETPAELAGERLRATWQITDFHKMPLFPASHAELRPLEEKSARGWNQYRAVIDLSALPLKTGPYYEVAATLDLGAPLPARDIASFATLPEPATLQLDPMDSPFGAHTWNATVKEYFPLAARLGIRRCLVFWSWPETAPYTPNFDEGFAHDSRIGWPRQYGMAPFGVVYPIMWIEHGDGPQMGDEALAEGLRQSIQKYKSAGLWGFQIGNEPPSMNPAAVERDVRAYKVAYEAIKATDPGIIAIGSAIGPNEAFFKAGFQPYQDVYNIHAYSGRSELRQEMRRYRELFAKYGGEKPIWSTEIGSKSQGLPRDVIARDIIQKAASFFADGGGYFTWFAIGGSNDPDGERTGSYSDSMDLFAAKYNMHLPRLDAVAYYHLINKLGAKKFVREAQTEAAEFFLFQDEQDNSLLITWAKLPLEQLHLSLPGAHDIALTHMNGQTRRLSGEGITLAIGPDPVFLEFRSSEPLPGEFAGPAEISFINPPAALTQGEVVQINVRASGKETALKLEGPPLWRSESPTLVHDAKEGVLLTWRIRVPEDTPARAATFRVTDETAIGSGHIELALALPVKSKIELDLQPIAGAREGEGGVRLIAANRSGKAQAVKWRVDLVEELPMKGGTYNLSDALPTQAWFGGENFGELRLGAGESREVPLTLEATDRQTLYTLRATATDATGNSVQRERRVGGFARVVRTEQPLNVDGKLDEPIWRGAPTLALNEARQFNIVEREAKPWQGLADLSGTLRFAWDDAFLYIGVEVVDDRFVNPRSDSRLWAQDGLQFLFDPYRAQPRSLGRYDYALGLGEKGPQVWRHMGALPVNAAGLVPDVKLAVTASEAAGGNRTYEIAFPWSALAPFTPEPGANLGGTMVINEDDGPGRASTIGWFGGVHLKEASFVGDLILAE